MKNKHAINKRFYYDNFDNRLIASVIFSCYGNENVATTEQFSAFQQGMIMTLPAVSLLFAQVRIP